MSPPSDPSAHPKLLLPGLTLGEQVRTSDDCQEYEGLLEGQDGACTVRIWTHVAVDPFRASDVEKTLQRLRMHAVGLQGVVPLLTAGVTTWQGESRLVTVHARSCSHRAAAQLERDVSTPFPAPATALADKLTPVVESLAALHDQGLVHAWLNPTVVCLAPRVTLDGFGLTELWRACAPVSRYPQSNHARYLAPELSTVFSSPAPSVDIYALALLFVELLRGSPLGSEAEARPQIDDPTSWDINLSPAAVKVLGSALSERSSRRPDSVVAFWNDLKQALETAPSTAPSPPAQTSAEVPPPRHEPAPNRQRSELLGVLSNRDGSPPASGSPVTAAAAPKPQRRPEQPAPQAPEPSAQELREDPRDRKDRLLVYALVGIGMLFVLAGIGAGVFFLSRASTSSATSSAATSDAGPPSTATVSPPVPSPAITLPGTGPADASPPDLHLEDTPLTHPWLMPSKWPKPSKQDASALVPIDDTVPLFGAQDAKVTIVLFVGLHGKPNRAQLAAVGQMLDEYPTSLRVALRLLPLSSSSRDERKALSLLQRFVTEKDPAVVWTGLTSGKPLKGTKPGAQARKLLQANRSLAGQLMVRTTPTLFIDGLRLNGFLPTSQLRFLLDEELKAAKAELIAGTKPSILYSSRTLFWITDGDADRKR